MKLVECVPNFSEGRDKAIIEAIAEAIRSSPGAELLDIDPGAATNRTVFTFAGAPAAVLEAAFHAIERGAALIDMRRHKGEHPRLGACDVCPFVPISGVTMEECIALARELARRVGEELKIPVYLYAAVAARPERVRLPDIRAGEYEGLAEKMKRPEWRPDFGPSEFNARSGATVIGARGFLIAYNVNLNTRDTAAAKEIASAIRESGRLRRGADGKEILGPDGKPERIPGLFKGVQATGWFIEEYGRAQVSINILDIEAAPLHMVYESCCEVASRMGLRVTGSEIVGMVPKAVLVEAGRYFLKERGASTGASEEEILRTAIATLGLSDVAPFDPAKKIIEERFRMKTPLAAMSMDEFLTALASGSPTPGGGSAAALAGALSAALSAMVAALTFEKKGFEGVRGEMEALGVKAHELLRAALAAVDEDAEAFDRVMGAMKLPKATDGEKAARRAAIEEALRGAAAVPMATLEKALPLLDLAAAAAERGNPNSLSDAGVAVAMARAAAHGAYYNVLINLSGIADEGWRREMKSKADEFLSRVNQKAAEAEGLVIMRLAKAP